MKRKGVNTLLERIQSPEDVKKLNPEELKTLCGELREFLIDRVSRTGGHLASNLGVVELTVAVHRVFDTAHDRLVFDVGHQCYVHKALTGRQELFSTLRAFRGLSGFPKPRESIHDAFIAGHASNSISVALGMARARTLRKQDYAVLALIGDGALTGGLAYEGMNNAGASGEPLIVILNDNGMSISPNVGSMPWHLNHLRSRPGYYRFKKWYRGLFGKHPAKNPVYRFFHRIKTVVKQVFLPGSSLFENMGFAYLGPVNGHDVGRLCDVLQWAREQNGPVLVHVLTQKGHGCPYAEQNPDLYHGVGPFDRETGQILGGDTPTFSRVFGETLAECGAEDPRVCAVTAAMADGTGLNCFAKAFPERFFDVGIAEGHGVSMSAGLASQGMVPVFAVYSTFLQRGYDQLIHDVALERLHVVLAVDRAGLVGPDGETHQGCFDALYLSHIPGFTVLCPSNFAELRSMLRRALFEEKGPVAVRYPRGGEGLFREDASEGALRRLRKGGAVCLVSYGVQVNRLLEAADHLALEGFEAEVWKINRIAPLRGTSVCNALGGKKVLLVLEDNFGAGSVGQRIAAILTAHGQAPEHLILKNLGSRIASEGSVPQLEHEYNLDAEGVARAVREALT